MKVRGQIWRPIPHNIIFYHPLINLYQKSNILFCPSAYTIIRLYRSNLFDSVPIAPSTRLEPPSGISLECQGFRTAKDIVKSFSLFTLSTSFPSAVLLSSTSTQDTDYHPYQLLGPVVELFPVPLDISARLEARISKGTLSEASNQYNAQDLIPLAHQMIQKLKA
ncbi:hypothetical protein PGT21_026363 [Puccinia graminis f. sp. tritici]|uniref:Uncharacterized protein n=1 Tax=Puccinia graminis f. sp. tritici TaxID=56615 RepID=A0A5B0N562_PUCGR|nr:hypothetical protein PGT21_026363 [Puccinia graminis f. sp. tritici]